MKALRLKFFQEMACYRKPFSNKINETFPLPPYSTAKGMIHHILGAKEYIPLLISIQGNYESLFTNLQRLYFVKEKHKTDEFPLIYDGLQMSPLLIEQIKTNVLNTHMLLGVNLVIHVHTDEKVLKQIHHAIHYTNETISLGRREDIVRIDECEWTEIHDFEGSQEMQYSAYIPKYQLINIDEDAVKSVNYEIRWKYEIKDNVRSWENIDVGYVKKRDNIRGRRSCESGFRRLLCIFQFT